MKIISPRLLRQLRKMANDGLPASRILRELHDGLPDEERTKINLIKHFREAFCLALHEASCIGGWSPESGGEIPDERLDELLAPAMSRHRQEWEMKAVS